MTFTDYLKTAKTVKLSKHFTLYNVVYSQTAVTKGIDNTPNPQIITNAGIVIKKILEPLVDHFKTLPDIHCFFRCPKLNQAVGGVATSQHAQGQAVDLTIVGIPDSTIVDWVRHNLDFDQIILEGVGSTHWVHISAKNTGNRKQCLKYDGKKYVAF